MEKKYRALRFVGTVYKVFGIITGVLTAISAIGFCAMSILGGSLLNGVLTSINNSVSGSSSSGPAGLFSGILAGVLAGGFILISGGITAITLYAAGEGIYLAIALEENTRSTASLLQQRNS
jgi:hypothetical protein